MKKLFEGASLISAFFLILTTVSFFVFNVQKQKEKTNERNKAEKEMYRQSKAHGKDKQLALEDQENSFYYYFEDEMKKSDSNKEELDYLRKKTNPLWHYYEDDKINIFPGIYHENGPTPLGD